jgi:CubicO group peptidase (beta-lactamase class C family)
VKQKWILGMVGALLGSSAMGQSLNTADIDAFINAQMKAYDVPGLAFAVVQDGKIVYTKGYGVRDLKTKTPVNADTLFAIGSSSKSFTALGVMQQVEAGKLDLDKPINTYLPKLKFSDSSKAPKVTLRRLLSMSTGLPRADLVWYTNENLKTRQQMLETIEKIPFVSEVGASWNYCNQNFIAAGAALETVSNQSWEAYTKANIFAPLGMNRSVFEWNDVVKDGNYALGYSAGFKGVEAMAPFDRLVIAGPAGSIHSSANEMARYIAFQLSNGQVNGKALVSKRLLDAMHKPEIAIDDFPMRPRGVALPGYGMGWFTSEYRGVKIVEHGGNINGFTAGMQLMPEKGLGFVILSSLDGAGEFSTTTQLGLTERLLNLQPRNDFGQSDYAKAKALQARAKTYQAKPEDLKKLEGTYTLTTGDTLEISFKNGQLSGLQSGVELSLIAASPTEYLVDFAGQVIELEFKESSNGVIWLYQGGELAGVRTPKATSSPTVAAKEVKDSQGRYSAMLPSALKIVQTTPNFTIAQSDAPKATFVLSAGEAKANLETSVLVLLKQVDSSFDLKPTRTDQLPVMGGVTWTQFLYTLPGGQTLAVVATERNKTVYMVAVQALTKDINAAAPFLNQIISSYKFGN